MKSSWWKLSTVLIFIIICSPMANSFTFDTNDTMNHDQYELTTPDYKNDWHVDRGSSIQNFKSYISDFMQERSDILEKYNDLGDGARNGPMDSAWPMQSHDDRHTGLSQYITVNNSGAEIWRDKSDWAGVVESSAVIDNNNIIYYGTHGTELIALYPNGTRKWHFQTNGLIWGTPALADNGDIYCTTWGGFGYLQAITKDGTERWRFYQESSSTSAPTIGSDGTIYFGTDGHIIFAINPDGTEKWRYTTGYIVMGSPAIGQDGTIYIGSGDYYLYALYPNGTLRWRFNTGSEIKGEASIADDGTIYVPSFNNYLYALYPNGTLKWKAYTGDSIAAAGVTLADDGTIYVGTELLRAYYPNGTLIWATDVEGDIYGTVPAVSADGNIYVSAGGSLVAVNPNGTEQWRKQLTIAQIMSSPCIGLNDRVYVGSEDYGAMAYGYLHAFGLGPLRAEAGGPYQGTALRPTTLIGLAFGGFPPYTYHWDFGDGNTSTEINPTHTYTTAGNYIVTFAITDKEGNISTDTTTMFIDYPYPTVSITRPTKALYIADKKIIPFPFPLILGKITVEVDATQEHYGINRVEFYVHGTLQVTDITPPYSWTWTQGNFRLFDNIWVTVWDTQGRYAEQNIDIIKWF